MTVKRYALVKDGVVDNIILMDDEDSEYVDAMQEQHDAVVELPEPVGVGYTYDGKAFSPPSQEDA